MPFFQYYPNVPNAPDDPADDQPQMQTNTLSTQNLINVDHGTFNDNANGGYHRTIHQILASVNPAATANINTIFSKNVIPDTTGGTSDSQLFTISRGGIVSRLTGALVGSASASDGWQWVGGVLLQWGIVLQNFTSGNTTFGTVTFKDRVTGAIPFPNNCFIVTATPLFKTGVLNTPSSAGNINIENSTLSNTSFDWLFYSNSTKYKGFFWFAIGN